MYSYRDEFFETHQIEEAQEKPKLLKDKLDECLQALDKLNCKTDATFCNRITELVINARGCKSSGRGAAQICAKFSEEGGNVLGTKSQRGTPFWGLLLDFY